MARAIHRLHVSVDRCLLGLAMVLMPLLGGAAERGWYAVESANFQMYSNARDSDARRLLAELETFRYVVSRFLGLAGEQKRPALVFLFRNDAEFIPFKPLFNGQPRPLSGLHVRDPLDDALALSRRAQGTATMRVLFHEYTHLLTARPFRHAPVWIHEGVAETFSTFAADGDQFDIGVALTNHVRFLQQQHPLPVSALLQIDRESPDYNEQQRAGSFYATSWLLAHYLLFSRRGFESNTVARYAALCSASTNQTEAFRGAFGSMPGELDATLRGYLQGGDYVTVRQRYPDLETAHSRKRSLRPGELDYALGRLLQMTQSEAARERLERAARDAPADPRPREALALMDWRGGDLAGQTKNLNEALRLGSQDPFCHYLAAQSRYEAMVRSRLADADRTTALREARAFCERALRLDPGLAQAHHLLGVIVLAQHPRTPALAVPHLQEALRWDPFDKPTRLTWASLLAMQGNLGAARLVVSNLLAGPMAPDLRAAATEILSQIENRLRSSRSRPLDESLEPGR